MALLIPHRLHAKPVIVWIIITLGMFNTLSCHSEELVHPSITSTPGRTYAGLAPFDEWMPFVSNAEVRTIRDTTQPPGRYLSVYLEGAASDIMATVEKSLTQMGFSRAGAGAG
jgi:hypothetical protein